MVQTRVGPGLGCTRAISSSHAVWFVARGARGDRKGSEASRVATSDGGGFRSPGGIDPSVGRRWIRSEGVRRRRRRPRRDARTGGPHCRAARVRRFGSCGGVSSSPQRRFSRYDDVEGTADRPGGRHVAVAFADRRRIARAAVSTRGGIDRAITTTCACCDLATPDNALRTADELGSGSRGPGAWLVPSNGARSSYASARVAPRQGSRGEGPQEGPGRALSLPRCSTRSRSTAVKRLHSLAAEGGCVGAGSRRVVGGGGGGSFERRGALRCGSPRSPPTSGTGPRRTCSSSPRASTRARSTRRACAPPAVRALILLEQGFELRAAGGVGGPGRSSRRRQSRRVRGADAWIQRGSLNEAVLPRVRKRTWGGSPGRARRPLRSPPRLFAAEDAADRRRSSSSSLEDGERRGGARGGGGGGGGGGGVDARGAGIVRRVPEGRRRRAGALLRAGAVSRRGGRRRVLQRKRPRPGGRRAIFGGVLRSRLRAARPRGAPRAGPPHLATTCATRGVHETLGDALALWALGAGSDARAGASCARVGAFSHPAAMELAEGAPPSGRAPRAAQAQAGDRRRGRWTLGRRRSSDATRARRNRGGVRPGQSGWFAAGCVFPLGAG